MNFKWPDHVMFLAELQMESRSEIELRTWAADEIAESGHFSKLYGFGWVSKKKTMFCRKSLLCWVGLAHSRYLYIDLSFNARIAQAWEYQGETGNWSQQLTHGSMSYFGQISVLHWRFKWKWCVCMVESTWGDSFQKTTYLVFAKIGWFSTWIIL